MNLESLYRKAPPWLQGIFLNAYALQVYRHRYGMRLREEVDRAADRERWPATRIREYQDDRVRAMVRHAFDKTPFYRDRMREVGLMPDQIQGTDDLVKMPLLTKDDVRAHGTAMMSAPKPRPGWLHGHTSGTTGTPLGLWYDRATCVLTNAMDLRQKAWAGMKADDWLGLLLGRTIVNPARVRPPFWQANYVLRQVWFSSFHLKDTYLPAYVAEIRRRGLRFLEGYPSTLFILAQYLLRTNQTLPMHATFTSSETLHDVQREAIEAAFQAPIFDFYGHAERTIFATECEAHDGKHLAEDFGYVEIVDAAGEPVPEGQPGYLVGTSLHNRAMPMIRYRTSDVSRILTTPCACGLTHRRIENVTTKAEDIVVTPDGRMISPSILTHPFKPFDTLEASQIVQEAPDHIRVRLVPSAAFTEEDQEQLRHGLSQRLGPEVTIAFEIVEEIPREDSGKFRWVISRVDHATHFDWANGSGGNTP